jgi:hypothetical protein
MQQTHRRGKSSRNRPRGKAARGAGGGDDDEAGAGARQLQDLMRVALDAGVAQLVDMGYSRSKALDALQECSCDVELAVEYLSATCC